MQDEDKSITAHFEIHTYELEVNVEGHGNVDIAPDMDEYDHGGEVTLTASPEEGWYFAEWTGAHTGTEEEITIIMDEDKVVTANFEIYEYDLTINVEGEGSTIPEEGAHTYEYGEEVLIEATPDDGWYFEEWTGDHTGTDEGLTVVMDEDKEITAHFEIYEYDLTINTEGQGSTDPYEDNYVHEHGEQVVIEAIPAGGWYFVEWTGDHHGIEEEITVVMDEDKEITAHFEEYDPAHFEVEITDYLKNVRENEEIIVKYTVRNTGELEGTQDIRLYLDEEEVAVERDVTIPPGDDYEGEFTLNAEEVGEHNFELSSSDTSEGVMVMVEEDSVVSNYWWLIVLLLVGVIVAVALVLLMSSKDDDDVQEDLPPPPPGTQYQTQYQQPDDGSTGANNGVNREHRQETEDDVF